MDPSAHPDGDAAARSSLGPDQFRQLLDSLFVFAGLCDSRGVLLEANRAALLAAGLTLAEVVGRPFEATWWWSHDPEVQARVREALDQAAAGVGSRFDTVVRLPDRDETERRVAIDFQVVPIYDEQGKVAHLVPSALDISAPKATEQALRESEQRFRATFENAAVGIAHVALDGRFVRVNEAVCRATGYRAEELTALTFQGLTHPDDLAADLAQLDQLRQGAIDRYVMEKRYFRKDGEIVWVNLSVSLIRDAAGAPDHFIAVIEDITARRAAQEALAESEERFRNMADHSPMMIWVTDRDNGATYLNRTWREFTAQGDDESAGFGWLEAVHPDDRDEARRVFLEAAAERQPFRLEYRLRRGDGVYVWALDAGAPRYDDVGRFLGYVGSVLDINERRRQEEGLRQADRQKDQFLAMLGHELRNPLAPIRNALAVLTGDPRPEDAARAREVLVRQSEHLRCLIDDLLDVSRIGRGKIRLDRSPLDLAALLANAVADHWAEAEAREVLMQVDLGTEPLCVDGDATRLTQVVANLLNNSLKFTAAGGRIEVRLVREEAEAVLTVSDSGSGLAPEMIETLFEPFVQAQTTLARAAGGLGLGLALVQGLIDAHGGTVSAASDGPGRGTSLTVRLPLTESAATADDALSATADDAPSVSVGDTLRILVVEDNADAAEMLALLLSLDGHQTRTAPDVMAALLELPEFHPQLVLCDLGLPGEFDGFGFAAAVRSDPRYRDSYLVALTGYGRPEDRRQALSCGFNDHLTKPAGMTELSRVIAAAARARVG